MKSSKRQRNRGFLLTERGRSKWETARQAAEKLDNQGNRYTLEQLALITGLDLSTITRVLSVSTRIDRRTLERLFKGFNLELNPEDFYKPQLLSSSRKQLPAVELPVYYPANDRLIYGRELELERLKECLSNSQVITLYGISGIGKTALTAKLVDEVKDDFQYLYWRSLLDTDSLSKILVTMLRYFSLDNVSGSFEAKIALLISFLQQYRCLLVFDNVEAVLDRHTTAFFNYLSTTVHRSCLILISRQRLDTVALTKSQSLSLPSINLVAVKKLLGDRQIIARDKILTELTNRYDAHPLSLHLAATTILDLFDGDVEEFLAHNTSVFSEIERQFDRQLEQLSEAEISVLYWLAINGELASLSELEQDLGLLIFSAQIVEGLSRLRNYLFIEQRDGNFVVSPLIKKYTINYLVRQVCQQIEDEQTELLTAIALMKANVSEYRQRQQIEFILKPIIQRLLARLGRDRLLATLSNLLSKQRRKTPRKPGYLAGNIFNLLRYLHVDFRRWNFSHLSVWQADGRGLNLRQCNFSFADLSQSRFTEDFGDTLSLVISPDGAQLAACDTNGQIRLWELKSKRQQLTLRGHSAWTQMVAYSPDGQTLASCSSDRTIRLWNLASGKCIGVLKSHQGRVRAIAFTPDGQTLASGGDDITIQLWDVKTQIVKLTLVGHTKDVRSIVITPDSKTLISSGGDGSIRFWSLSGKCLRTVKAHKQSVWTIAISPDGSLIASGSLDSTVKLWNSRTGEEITTLTQHQGTVSQVAFSPDGKQLASASYDRTVRIWNLATKQSKILPHDDWVQSLVFTDAGKTLITSSRDRTIKYWNNHTGEIDTTISSYSNGIWAIAVSSDGKQIASTNDEQTIQLWDVTGNQIERILTGHSKSIWSVAYSPDNLMLASASDDCTVRIWDATTGELCNTIQNDTWFWTVAFSPNNCYLAAAGADCMIRLWNPITGELIQTLTEHKKIIRHLIFNTEGNYLASCGLDTSARVWQVNTGKCLAIFNHPSPVSSAAFHPKQSLLATGSDDNVVRLWDYKTGSIIQSWSEHTAWIQSVAFSPDGELLASSSHDGTIKLWDVTQQQAIVTLVHGGWVRAIAFRICTTTKQLQLVSGSNNGTIKIWDISSRKCIKTLNSPQPYSQMNITGVTGLTELERETLIALGAVEANVSTKDNVIYLRQFPQIISKPLA